MDLKTTFLGSHPVAKYAENPLGLISLILPNAYILAGVILFGYLIAGGFMVIGSNGDAHQAETGQQAMTNAIIGFIVIFASYWIIQLVGYVSGVNILAPTLSF